MRHGVNNDRTKVSILIPCFNEEANVANVYAAVTGVFRNLPDYDYEIIFTDNHSTDRTFALLRDMAARDPKVHVIRFSRNCGYQRSLLTAYKAATGDCSIQLDCDLQDPPELIPQMLDLWRQGHQVVYGIRRSTDEGAVTSWSTQNFMSSSAATSARTLSCSAWC